jgi:hypothetical protein
MFSRISVSVLPKVNATQRSRWLAGMRAFSRDPRAAGEGTMSEEPPSSFIVIVAVVVVAAGGGGE